MMKTDEIRKELKTAALECEIARRNYKNAIEQYELESKNANDEEDEKLYQKYDVDSLRSKKIDAEIRLLRMFRKLVKEELKVKTLMGESVDHLFVNLKYRRGVRERMINLAMTWGSKY